MFDTMHRNKRGSTKIPPLQFGFNFILQNKILKIRVKSTTFVNEILHHKQYFGVSICIVIKSECLFRILAYCNISKTAIIPNELPELLLLFVCLLTLGEN